MLARTRRRATSGSPPTSCRPATGRPRPSCATTCAQPAARVRGARRRSRCWTRLPRNASGKVDRRALPAPDGRRVEPTDFVGPADRAEEAVAAIWADVLGLATGSAATTTSSPRAGTRCWPPARSAGCARRSPRTCRCTLMFEHPTVAGAAARGRGRAAGRGATRRVRRRGLDRTAQVRRGGPTCTGLPCGRQRRGAVLDLAGRPRAAGGLARRAASAGTKEECLAHIDEVWTDMRPLSLRLHMAATD